MRIFVKFSVSVSVLFFTFSLTWRAILFWDLELYVPIMVLVASVDSDSKNSKMLFYAFFLKKPRV